MTIFENGLFYTIKSAGPTRKRCGINAKENGDGNNNASCLQGDAGAEVVFHMLHQYRDLVKKAALAW